MKTETDAAQPDTGQNRSRRRQRVPSNQVSAVNVAVHNFVGAVLAHSFVLGASGEAVIASSRWISPAPLWAHKQARQPTMPMNCVINAVADICATSAVDCEETLVEVVGTIRAQFGVADECDKEDEAWVLKVLEHVLTTAETDARSALAEANAGFPVSDGSVARWIECRRSGTAGGWM